LTCDFWAENAKNKNRQLAKAIKSVASAAVLDWRLKVSLYLDAKVKAGPPPSAKDDSQKKAKGTTTAKANARANARERARQRQRQRD
jgi:hypothetical protein